MDRDAVELPVPEQGFPLEEAYTELQVLEEGYIKTIEPCRGPMPLRACGRFARGSALSNSECLLPAL